MWYYFAETYADLWKWSVKHYDVFWEKFFHFSCIKSSQPYSEVSMVMMLLIIPEPIQNLILGSWKALVVY